MKTDFVLKSTTTYNAIDKGSEKAIKTTNFKADGLTTDTITSYFYRSDLTHEFDAGDATRVTADSYMTRSNTVRGDGTPKQTTYYTGTEAGEEVALWSKEFNYNGTNLKTITNYTVNGSNALIQSDVYKYVNATAFVDSDTKPL